jgi:carotenoid cleavage dioxygenase-like enzyme
MDDYVNATGYQVAQWANTGLHGGLSVSHKPHVWDDTLDNTINNDSLLNLAIQYLKGQGIPVRA